MNRSLLKIIEPLHTLCKNLHSIRHFLHLYTLYIYITFPVAVEKQNTQMSVEDIDFLYKNSTVEDIIILVDSDKRDKLVWHEPNEFQIDFVQPFKLVCGVDVLDINIPRTMYSIETHNSRLNFKTGFGIDWQNFDEYTQIECEVRDYTIQELMNELNIDGGVLQSENIVVASDTLSTNENRKSVLLFSNTDNPPKPFIFDMENSTIASILGFDEIATTKKPHMYTKFTAHKLQTTRHNRLFASVPVNRRSHTLSNTRNSASTTTVYVSSYNNVVQELVFHNEVVRDEVNMRQIDDLEPDVEGGPAMPANASYVLKVGEEPNVTYKEDKYSGFLLNGITIDSESTSHLHPNALTFTDDNNTDVVVPVHPVEPRLKLTFYKVDFVTTEAISSLADIRTTIHTLHSTASDSSSSLPSYVTRVSPSLFLEKTESTTTTTYEYKINDDDFNTNVFSLVPIEPFAGIHYLFRVEFDFDDFRAQFMKMNEQILNNYLEKYKNSFNATTIENYIVSEFAHKARCSLKIQDAINSTHISVYDTNANDTNDTTNGSLSIVYNASYVDQFQLTAPGLVKLMGERYVTVHCDNIENHLRGSNMFNEYSPGMAVVNLGVVGYSHQRMDFTSVKYKKFHPIGKLNNMKFTVKRGGNQLYDLKGVNWHMLLSVKYYVPRIDTMFSQSTLNPNYDHDYMKYANKYINKYATSESDPEDEADDHDNLPSSSYIDMERELHHEMNRLEESEHDTDSSSSSSEYSSNEYKRVYRLTMRGKKNACHGHVQTSFV